MTKYIMILLFIFASSTSLYATLDTNSTSAPKALSQKSEMLEQGFRLCPLPSTKTVKKEVPLRIAMSDILATMTNYFTLLVTIVSLISLIIPLMVYTRITNMSEKVDEKIETINTKNEKMLEEKIQIKTEVLQITIKDIVSSKISEELEMKVKIAQFKVFDAFAENMKKEALAVLDKKLREYKEALDKKFFDEKNLMYATNIIYYAKLAKVTEDTITTLPNILRELNDVHLEISKLCSDKYDDMEDAAVLLSEYPVKDIMKEHIKQNFPKGLRDSILEKYYS